MGEDRKVVSFPPWISLRIVSICVCEAKVLAIIKSKNWTKIRFKILLRIGHIFYIRTDTRMTRGGK